MLATNVTAATVPTPGVVSSRPAFEAERGKERDRDKEKERERERKKERERERETRKTDRDQKSAWVDVVDTNVTAATVTKPGVASSRPAFEAKRGKERDRDREKGRERERKKEKERERERERERPERQRETRNRRGSTSLTPMSPPQP